VCLVFLNCVIQQPDHEHSLSFVKLYPGSATEGATMLAQGGARLAWGLLDALGVGRVVVAAHSSGALAAARMAIRWDHGLVLRLLEGGVTSLSCIMSHYDMLVTGHGVRHTLSLDAETYNWDNMRSKLPISGLMYCALAAQHSTCLPLHIVVHSHANVCIAGNLQQALPGASCGATLLDSDQCSGFNMMCLMFSIWDGGGLAHSSTGQLCP
jgi:pimeloyl-ACP methyl ester carboxylesterase